MIKKYELKNGQEIYLDDKLPGISDILIKQGWRENAYMYLIEQHCRGNALDLGGNVGFSTLVMSKYADYVHAFEPDSRNFNLLQKNMELSSCPMEVSQHAVSDKVGTGVFLQDGRSNLSRLDESGSTAVQMVTLDSLYDWDTLDPADLPNFIKFDVEGHEVEILNGAKRLLEEVETCKILIEVHPGTYSKTHNFREILVDLVGSGDWVIKHFINAKGWKNEFEKMGLSVIKSFTDFSRAVFAPENQSDIIDWASDPHPGKGKPVRAIMLQKGSD